MRITKILFLVFTKKSASIPKIIREIFYLSAEESRNGNIKNIHVPNKPYTPMFPNYKDFQIAVYYTLGKALPKHIEEVQTEIIENFDIKYNSPMLAHPLLRTPITRKSSSVY